jgi:hypothetical protein
MVTGENQLAAEPHLQSRDRRRSRWLFSIMARPPLLTLLVASRAGRKEGEYLMWLPLVLGAWTAQVEHHLDTPGDGQGPAGVAGGLDRWPALIEGAQPLTDHQILDSEQFRIAL